MMAEYDIERIAQDVMNRLADATADVADAAISDPDMWGSDNVKNEIIRLKANRCRDLRGALADFVYNEDDFLDMARDWIWDESHGDDATFDAVCECMAGKWAQKAELFRSWKHGRKEVRDEGA